MTSKRDRRPQQALLLRAAISTSNETIPGRNQPTVTIPTRNHLDGDFSDLLQLPIPRSIQDLRSADVRPDPARPGGVHSHGLPGQHHPEGSVHERGRVYKNPLFGLYQAMMPAPNRNFITPTTAPTSNYFEGAQPNLNTYTQGGPAARLQHLVERPCLLQDVRQPVLREPVRLDL